ncbi:MAG: transposase [Chloroflexota bacterium]|nr:transposase [Chloroflexota bacterium]
MKTRTFTEAQIVQLLREAETGEETIGSVCHAHGISENTFYTWRKQYGGVDVAAVKRLRELEHANARRAPFGWRILAERELEVDVLKEVLAKK